MTHAQMELEHLSVTQHTYRGKREKIVTLIEWLMDRSYWFEVEISPRADEFLLTCGCTPEEIQHPTTKAGADALADSQ